MLVWSLDAGQCAKTIMRPLERIDLNVRNFQCLWAFSRNSLRCDGAFSDLTPHRLLNRRSLQSGPEADRVRRRPHFWSLPSV